MEKCFDRVVADFEHVESYSKVLKKAMSKWGTAIPPMTLRKTLPSAMDAAGRAGNTLERYIGHSLGTV
jgi:hypothetical protein